MVYPFFSFTLGPLLYQSNFQLVEIFYLRCQYFSSIHDLHGVYFVPWTDLAKFYNSHKKMTTNFVVITSLNIELTSQ